MTKYLIRIEKKFQKISLASEIYLYLDKNKN
jgi:hypothetical protein